MFPRTGASADHDAMGMAALYERKLKVEKYRLKKKKK